VTVHYGPHEIAGAVRAQGGMLKEAWAGRARIAMDLDASQKRVADLSRQLEEKSALHRSALTLVQRLREERSGLRDTIATLKHQIDGLKAAACDAAPQLLRDSMRVTQEESARLRADLRKVTEERDALLRERPNHRLAGVFEMQDRLVEAAENAEHQTAEIASLRQRVAVSEAYAQHLLAALNAVSGSKGMP
jgi:chromosome segregation ATPase